MPPPLPADFRRLAWANLAAHSAEQISLAAVPIVAVLALDAGPGEIGALAVAQTLPFLLLAIPLGLLADRQSRRALIVASEALRWITALALVVAALTGQVSIPLLAVLGFIGAAGTVGFSVAAPTLLPALVPRESLATANGRLELARSVAFAAGPALAGALVSWAGAPAAFVLAAMLSGAALVALWRLPDPPRTPAPPRHPLLELRDGAAFVWRHAMLRPIILTGVAWNLGWFVLQAVYVPYAVRTLGLSASGVGVTLATYGAGMVVGALGASRVLRRITFGQAIIAGPLTSVVGILLMLATLVWPQAWLASLSYFCFGFGPILWVVGTTTLRQAVTPGAMLGRVSAIFLTVNMGARPLGAALGGVVGEHWGEGACLWLATALFVVQALIILGSAVRGLRTLPAPV